MRRPQRRHPLGFRLRHAVVPAGHRPVPQRASVPRRLPRVHADRDRQRQGSLAETMRAAYAVVAGKRLSSRSCTSIVSKGTATGTGSCIATPKGSGLPSSGKRCFAWKRMTRHSLGRWALGGNGGCIGIASSSFPHVAAIRWTREGRLSNGTQCEAARQHLNCPRA